MFKNRLMVIFTAVVLLALTLFFIRVAHSTTVLSSAAASGSQARQLSGDMTFVNGNDMSDYALRHPQVRPLLGAAAPDMSDYFERHRDAQIVPITPTPDLSDYFLRHRDTQITH